MAEPGGGRPVTVELTAPTSSFWSRPNAVALIHRRFSLRAPPSPKNWRRSEPPWVWWRLGLLDFDHVVVGLLGSLERCFELRGWTDASVAGQWRWPRRSWSAWRSPASG
jgi:hypothetical protein